VVRRNALANYAGQAWTALMGIAFVPLYIHYLGIEAYGIVGLMVALQAWLVILDLGIAPTMEREMARFTARAYTAHEVRNLLRTVEVLAVGIACTIVLAIYSASGWIAHSWIRAEQLQEDTVRNGIVVLGIVTACRFVETIYRSCVIGLQMQVRLNVVSATLATIRGLGAVGVLAFVSSEIRAFLAWQAAASFSSIAAFAWLTYRALPPAPSGPRISLAQFSHAASFARGMLGIAVSSLLLTQLDKIILSRLLALSDYGYYTVAGSVAGALFMLASPITQALYPRLTQLHSAGNQAGLAEAYHKGAQAITAICGSTAVTVAIFAEPLLLAWTKNPVLAGRAAPILSLLMIGNFANALMWMPYHAQLAFGWTRLALGLNSAAAVVFVPVLFAVVPVYGGAGAAWAWFALNLFYLIVGVRLMHRRILRSEYGSWLRRDVLMPLGAALLPLCVARLAINGSEPLLLQITFVAIAFVASAGCAVLSCVALRVSAFELLRRSKAY
jgi:O-antigen/teichoic acid export membrane protein